MTTMVQAGLFENMVLTAESQTREAKYHRAYRSNPENRKRINSQKKRRRLLKKEKELGNVSCIFESEAAATKLEPQTVENVLNRYDNQSLSNSDEQANKELSDSSRGYHQKSQYHLQLDFNRDPERDLQTSKKAIPQEANNQAVQKQVELLALINQRFEQLGSEIDGIKRIVETTSPGKLTTSGVEKQNVIADEDKVQKSAKYSKQTFFSAVFLTALTALASWFVAQQTSPLYKSLNIPIPELASYGALALAISLSGFASIKGSRLAKGFLAVMFCYELLLVIAGTKVNQKDLMQEALKDNPSYSHAQETQDITKKDYEYKKARYENESSKVYQNAWYKRKIIDPAYEKYTAATEELSIMKAKLSDNGFTGHMDLILKILFRITAIVVAIMSPRVL